MANTVKIAKLSEIEPDLLNANRHTERGNAMLRQSMEQFGFAEAGTLDRHNRIIGGNHRTEIAADVLDAEDVIIIETDGKQPIYIKRNDLDLSTEEGRRLSYMLNRSAQVSIDFDPERIWADIESGVELGDMFREDELKEILGELETEETEGIGSGEPPIDKAEELQEKWQCESGQIWQIESKANPGHYHRLICGDCRDMGTVEALTEGRKVNGIFTSPPYAMQRAKQYGGTPADEYVDWWKAVQTNMRAILAEDGSFFVNIKPHCKDGQRVLYVFDLILAMVRRWEWRFVDELCWTHQGIMGKWANRFKNQFEPVYHFSRRKSIKLRHENIIKKFSDTNTPLSVYNGINNRPAHSGSPFKQGGKRSAIYDGALPGNIVNINNNHEAGETINHAATFPLKLPTFFIKAYSDPLDTWLDPFAGSGTVGCAAENEGRLGLMVEQLPKYCAVILQRFFDHTSIQPELIK
jgi:DNA modification methylase